MSVPSASMVMIFMLGIAAVGRVGEDDVAAVRGPGGEVAGADVVRELDPLLVAIFHDVDVLAAGAPGPYLRFQAKAMNWPLGDQEGDVA